MSFKKLIVILFLSLTTLSIVSIYYKYIVLGDFAYETADFSEFPDE